MAFPQATQTGVRKILNYSAIKPLTIPAVNAFAAKYTKEYCYVATTPPQIEYPTDALFPMFVKRWQERQEPFWWAVIARKDIENHRSVRSWVARRLRHAFMESLRKKGYKPDGNRIDGYGEPLIGTAQLLPHESIIRKEYTDLVYQTDLTVEAILKRRYQYKPSRMVLGQEAQEERRPLYWKKKPTKAPEGPEAPYRHPTSRSLKL
ncbi:uncharacterized protein K444DRAFT_111422 [Hyaloscypha bicolor E]|uniref:Uncharacterized protein n=1 Tax=Hyaloscypha bicolor E TaxID=1095630 RepID=A0A2J6SVA8_9HELO|nr:uncharacterized protein K444DRAFT_111422 [Hyaloscypha bicolor E]PMD54706.1 hypothetical protein K444DRAFT_111422 [Hyaloscypha bicolor E]